MCEMLHPSTLRPVVFSSGIRTFTDSTELDCGKVLVGAAGIWSFWPFAPAFTYGGFRLQLLMEAALTPMTQDEKFDYPYSKNVSRTSSGLPSGGALE